MASKKLLLVAPLAVVALLGCEVEDPAPKPSNTTYTPRHKTTNKVPPKTAVRPSAQKSPFASCRQAMDAGTVPIYPSHPRWNPKLDYDHDGMACEH